MILCQRVQRLIGVYRELDRAEARMVDAHLRECPTCRQAWSDEQRVRSYLASIPVLEVPRHLQPQLLAIPATVAATPSLLAILLRLLGLLILGFGLGSIAGDRSRALQEMPAASPAREAPAQTAAEPFTALDAPQPAAPSRLAAAPRPAPVSRDAAPALRTPEPTPGIVEPVLGSPFSNEDRDEDEPRRERVALALPTRGANPGPGNVPAVQTAPADAVSPTRAAPSPTARSCAALTVLLYADVGIEGTAIDDCVVCDGRLGPADRSAWLESNHVLPDGLQLTIWGNEAAEPLFDDRIDANGQALISISLESADHPWICDRDRISLQLGMPGSAFEEGWQPCPRGPGHQRELALSESRSVAFGLTRACPTHPEPEPPAPEPDPSDEPPPAPQPTATPKPLPSAEPQPTEPPAPSPMPTQATEEPGPGSGNAPDPEPGPPSGAPSATPPGSEAPQDPPPDPPTPKPEPTTPGPVPPPPTEL